MSIYSWFFSKKPSASLEEIIPGDWIFPVVGLDKAPKQPRRMAFALQADEAEAESMIAAARSIA